MEIEDRWHCIQKWRQFENRSFDIKNKIKLVDPSKRKEYTLVQKISKDSNVYKAIDGLGEVYHLKVIQCLSHSMLKQYAKTVRAIQKLPSSSCLLQIYDQFPVCEKGRWALIILSKFIDAVSLEEWIRFRNSVSEEDRHLLKVKKEAMIYAFLDLIKILQFFHDRNLPLGAVNPKNVLIEKVNHRVPDAFHYHGDVSFRIKISATSSENFGLPVRYPHLKLENAARGLEFENDIWGLGYIVYAVMTDTPSCEIPNFNRANQDGRKGYFKNIEYSISLVLSSIFNENQNRKAGDLLYNPIIKIWNLIKEREQLDTSDPEVLPGLFLGLQFENPAVSVRCFEAILKLAIDYRITVYDYLISGSITNVFLRAAASYQNWGKSSQLLNIFLDILHSRLDIPSFKEKIMRFGVLEILRKIDYTIKDININLIFDIFFKFSMGNTLTILQLAQEVDLLKMAESQRAISTNAKNFMYTVSHYGPSSVNFIKELWTRRVIDNEIKLLQKLYEVPAFFKVDHFATALFIIDEVLKNIGRAHTKEVFLNTIMFVICNIGELLCMPRFLTYLSCIGECPNHYIQKNIDTCYRGRNPLLAFCKICNVPLCNACAAYSHPSDHMIEYCHYQSPHTECGCKSRHELPDINLEDLQLPDLPENINLIDSRGKKCNLYRVNHLKSIRPQYKNTLKTVESLVSSESRGMRCYYEVKVISAGYYEDIILSYEKTGVEYHGKDGKIFRNGVEYFQGPRFGSYDTVGLGLTYTHVIVTYNGLMLHPLIPIDLPNDIIPWVTVNGDHTSVNFNLSELKFKPPINLSDFESMFEAAHVEKSKNILKKLGRKVFESSKAMKRKEFRDRVEEIRAKTAEVLIHLNKRLELERLQNKSKDCVTF